MYFLEKQHEKPYKGIHAQYKLQFFIIRFNRHGKVFVNVSKCLLHMCRLF